MLILHAAAGPAGLAVNVLSPSSLLSSDGALGLFAIVFAETGAADRARRGNRGPNRTPAGAPAPRSRKPSGQDQPMSGRSHMTVFTRTRCGGQPKGIRCLP